jgi:hypothetical protein
MLFRETDVVRSTSILSGQRPLQAGKEEVAVTKVKPSTVVPVFVVGVIGAVLWANAGSLTPPPGPVASTMKTLDEVEPRVPIRQSDLPLTITSSGSYYVVENLNYYGTAIDIQADHVSIDLEGHVFRGRLETHSGSVHSVTNGFVNDGHVMLGDHSEVTDVVSIGSPVFFGIWVGDDSRIVRCLTANTEDEGFRIGNRSIIINCSYNGGGGGGGVVTGNDCIIQNCSFKGQHHAGIACGNNCVITNCTISQGSGWGIQTGTACTISGSVVSDTDFGIDVGNSSTVKHLREPSSGLLVAL